MSKMLLISNKQRLTYDGTCCSEIIIEEYSQKQSSDVAQCNLVRACCQVNWFQIALQQLNSSSVS
jgi:hypothetical protein